MGKYVGKDVGRDVGKESEEVPVSRRGFGDVESDDEKRNPSKSFKKMLFRSVSRLRIFLWPHASKGFNPHQFDHVGEALRWARQSKKLPIWRLGWATGIKWQYLASVERGVMMPTWEEIYQLEKYLGVTLRRRNKAKIDKVP